MIFKDLKINDYIWITYYGHKRLAQILKIISPSRIKIMFVDDIELFTYVIYEDHFLGKASPEEILLWKLEQ